LFNLVEASDLDLKRRRPQL